MNYLLRNVIIPSFGGFAIHRIKCEDYCFRLKGWGEVLKALKVFKVFRILRLNGFRLPPSCRFPDRPCRRTHIEGRRAFGLG